MLAYFRLLEKHGPKNTHKQTTIDVVNVTYKHGVKTTQKTDSILSHKP